MEGISSVLNIHRYTMRIIIKQKHNSQELNTVVINKYGYNLDSDQNRNLPSKQRLMSES